MLQPSSSETFGTSYTYTTSLCLPKWLEDDRTSRLGLMANGLMTTDMNMTAGTLNQPNRNDFLRRYEKLFFLTTVLVSALPGFAPVKLVAIVSLWCYLMVGDSFTIAAALWFVSVLLNLLLGAQVGAVFQGVPLNDVFNHSLRLILFFISLGVGSFTASRCSISQKRLDQLIFTVALGLMFFKLIIVVAVFAGISLDRIQVIFGFDTVTSGIGLGLQRLQFPSDIIVPFLVACYVGGEKKVKDGIFLFCVAGVILLSFSRYLFAFYLVCIFLRAFWIKKVDFITVLNSIVTVACVVILFESVLARFASADTTASDQVRVDQIHYLSVGIKSFPLLGTGIGSKAHDYLRSESTPYFYEAQWYATTMQMGFVGVSWYVLNILLALYVPLRRNYLVFTIVFLMWVFSGFTNPFLTALGSAFGLTILLLRCNGAQTHHPQPSTFA
jgi:hypothetical protein